MRRWLAAAFAVVSVIGSAIAVWLVVIDDDTSGGHHSAQAAQSVPAKPAPPAAVHFTVSVSGDLLMHQPLLDRALANGDGDEYDFAPFFDQIKPYVAGVDLGLCHVETPIGPGPPTTYPIFNTPTGLASSIKRSGWDGCDTASNHSLDGAQAGIDGTVAALDKADVAHTGSFASKAASHKPTIFKVDGVKLGFVAYTDATNGYTAPNSWSLNEYAADGPQGGAEAILDDVKAAHRAGADSVLVQIQWGDENSQTPNASQIAVAKRVTESPRVAAIVGQGPHVVQPIERIHDKFVVFSEGNLVSNQAASTGLPTATEDGLIAVLHFKADAGRVTVRKVEYVPTWVRLGDYEVLPAKPSSDQANAAALKDSYDRTVEVAGEGEGFGPAF